MIDKFLEMISRLRFHYRDGLNSYKVENKCKTEKFAVAVDIKEKYRIPENFLEKIKLEKFGDKIKTCLSNIKKNECLIITPIVFDTEKNNDYETKEFYTISITKVEFNAENEIKRWDNL